jgi:heavy metal sensor kinase
MAGALARGWSFLRTIRARLTLWYLAILAVTLVAFSAFLYVSLTHVLRATHEQDLLLESAEVAADLEQSKAPGRLTDLPSVPQSDAAVSVFDASGERMLGANVDDPPKVPDSVLTAAARGELSYQRLPKAGGGKWGVLTVPVKEDGQVVAVISLARPQDSVDANLAAFGKTLLVAIPLTLLLALAGGLFLAQRALNPIDRVTREAERFGTGDLSLRFNLDGPPDEVVRLAATFDRMLARIEQAFLRERQFTADASHELRTPLALLLSRTDLALERPREAGEYRETLAQIRQDLAGLNRLLNELLLLARAEAGREQLTLESLSLGDLAADVVGAMQPLAESRGVRLSCAARTRSAIAGDQMKLTQLLINLVDNAVKFTPAGGAVTVHARRRGGWAEIQVTDSGSGIPPADLPHVFERFYRVDKARSPAEGGSGLGLTISQWIAQAHGGGISATSRLGEGSTFVVRLPIKETAGTLDAKEGRQPLERELAAQPLHAGLGRVRS